MKEASKAARRRAAHVENVYLDKYFVGKGLDIGSGDDLITVEQYPKATEIVGYDLILGSKDAQTLPEIADESFDFIHSSHCLEHCYDPTIALTNWLRVLKSGGYLIACFPDELLYEQGQWPSRFNSDHKVSFTLRKEPVIKSSISVIDMITSIAHLTSFNQVQLLEDGYDYKLNVAMGSPFVTDQTYSPTGPECAIEIVLQKK
jgi:SAM-dependent methyltransferase